VNVYLWLGLDNPTHLLTFLLDSPVSERKLRLLLVGCCRRIWDFINDDASRRAVAVAERFANKQATAKELSAARKKTWWSRNIRAPGATADYNGDREQPAEWHAARAVYHCTMGLAIAHLGQVMVSAADAAANAKSDGRQVDDCFVERARHADLIRCIFGNPFRPVSFDPAWRTAGVMAVAQAIYNERHFGNMPILADIMEESGCTNGAVLDHCRRGDVHTRGCWVVDLVLGKT
jgi:hypothetical protein